MKKILLSLSILLCLGGDDAQIRKSPFNKSRNYNQQQIFNKTGALFLPQKEIRFSWDTAKWSSNPDTILKTYNINGQTVEETFIQTFMGNKSKRRTLYIYENGLQTQEISLRLNPSSSNWDSTGKVVKSYNNNRHQITSKYYNQNMGNWRFSYGDSTVYTYMNNQITTVTWFYWNSSSGNYKTGDKWTYTYNTQGLPIEIEMDNWNDTTNTFKKQLRFKDLVWKNWAGDMESSKIVSYAIESWENNQYKLTERGVLTYDTYDNEIEEKTEEYDGTNWSVVDWEKNNLTYNSSGALTESIRQEHDGTSFVNESRSIYDDFYTGLTKSIYNNPKISIYPNPISDKANIEIINNQESFTFKLFDMLGKEVRSENILNGNAVFEKQSLTPGVYFYKLINQSNIVNSGKLIIQ